MMDCGLIFGKPEGLSAKWWGFSGFGIIFNTKIMVDSVHGSWTAGGLGPPWTTRRRGPEATERRRRARRSSVPDRSRARKLTGEGRPWRGEDGEAGATLTWAREALWWPGNDGKSAAGEELGGGGVGPRRREEEEGDECGEDW